MLFAALQLPGRAGRKGFGLAPRWIRARVRPLYAWRCRLRLRILKRLDPQGNLAPLSSHGLKRELRKTFSGLGDSPNFSEYFVQMYSFRATSTIEYGKLDPYALRV